MMKRTISGLLALSAVLCLTGCVDKQLPDSGTSPSATLPVPTQQETAAPTQPDFHEIPLADNENITVKVTSVKPDDSLGYSMNLYLENKSDSTLMFTLDRVSVNGFMCDPFWAATVTPGMKANEPVTFLSSSLKDIGIDTVTDITFTLRVYPADDITEEDLLNQVCTIYPLGKDAVVPFVREAVDGEIVLFDNEYATMVIEGSQEDTLWGYSLKVYLENKTNQNLLFSVSDAAVNGFMCDPFWAVEVAAGKRCVSDISWFADTLKENGITEVESITLPVSVRNSDDWMADPLITETFTLNP